MRKKYEVNWFDMTECKHTDIVYANSAAEAEATAKAKYPINNWPAPMCKATLVEGE